MSEHQDRLRRIRAILDELAFLDECDRHGGRFFSVALGTILAGSLVGWYVTGGPWLLLGAGIGAVAGTIVGVLLARWKGRKL